MSCKARGKRRVTEELCRRGEMQVFKSVCKSMAEMRQRWRCRRSERRRSSRKVARFVFFFFFPRSKVSISHHRRLPSIGHATSHTSSSSMRRAYLSSCKDRETRESEREEVRSDGNHRHHHTSTDTDTVDQRRRFEHQALPRHVLFVSLSRSRSLT